MSNYSNRPQSKINSSMTVAARVYGYGSAIGITQSPDAAKSRHEPLSNLVRYYFGEYVLGLLFVMMVGLYAFVKPVISIDFKSAFAVKLQRGLKKALDIIVASIGLMLAGPLMLVVAALVKITSPGPVFYTQVRIGENRRRRDNRTYPAEIIRDRRNRDRRREDSLGRPFKVIKFRTMVNNAEKKSGPVWASRNDARITPLGKFLRKTRIDEIPQLINVLKGEMSMVGPRPERPFFVKDLSQKVPDYTKRLRVKPGVTGKAQVTTGYDTSLESVFNKVKNDVDYIRNWTIWSDLKILAQTVLVVITGKGAC